MHKPAAPYFAIVEDKIVDGKKKRAKLIEPFYTIERRGNSGALLSFCLGPWKAK